MRKLLALLLTLAMTLSLLSVGFVSASAEEPLPDLPQGAQAIGKDFDWANDLENDTYYYLTEDITIGSPEAEADLITLPSGVTIDGRNNTIHYGFIVETPESGNTHSKTWTHEIFAFGEGTYSIKNVKFGNSTKPVYLNARGISEDTSDWCIAMFKDAATADVTWENVEFWVDRTANGLSSLNTGAVMAYLKGTHSFTKCHVKMPTDAFVSAGSQAAGWFYEVSDGSVLTMTDCTMNGNLKGSYMGGFIHHAKGTLTMTRCINNATLNPSYSSTGGFFGGLVGDFQKGTIKMEGCINNGNISVGKLTIGGGIVGRTETSSVTKFQLINCVNNGNISTTGTTTSNNGFGGITGHTGSTEVYEVIGCVNNGNVAGTGNVGGIIGLAEGSPTKTIQNCVNNGDLSATSNVEAGGIIGQLRVNGVVENCKNYGAVNCANKNGGIVGQAYSTSTYTIRGCANFGTIGNTSTTYAAGILSYASVNDVEVTITNSANYGKIVSKQYSAGFVAENRNSLTITNSANYGEVAGVHAVGGFVGQSTNQTTTTATFTNCLNAGYIHQGPAAGEGIGGFFGRVAGAKAVISLTNCANIGTVTGSTKATAAYGAFGDCFGQFIGTYTVSAALNYEGTDVADAALVGGFLDWGAADITKPSFTNCYAYGTAEVATGAKSLKGWITATRDGETVTALTQATYTLTEIAVTEAPNDGIAGVNVEYTGTVTLLENVEFSAAVATLKTLFGLDFMAGSAEEDKIVVATPALRGYQMSTDGTSIRFLSTISSLNYANVGYTYSATLNGAPVFTNKVATTTNVLQSINAVEGEDDMTTKSATEMGGKYIVALTFINVPAEGTVVITLTPNAGDFSGTTYTITIVDGNVTTVAPAAAN